MTLSPSDSTPDLDALLTHSSWVRQLARAVATTRDLADEVEQEAWRIALERPPKHAGNLKAWWTRVVHTTLSQRGRSETRHQNRVDRLRQQKPEATSVAPVELAEQMEDTEWLARVVKELPPILGEAIYLRFYQDQSVAEIAQQLGIAQSAVKSRLRRGLEDLRSRFQNRHGENWRARCLALAAPAQTAATSVSLVSLLLMNNVFRLSAMVIAIAVAAFLTFSNGPQNEPIRTNLGPAGIHAETEILAASSSPLATTRTEAVGDKPISIQDGYDLIGKPDLIRDSRLRITILNADGTPFAGQRLTLSCNPPRSIEAKEAITDSDGVFELPCISKPWEFGMKSVAPDSEHCVDFREDIMPASSGLTEIVLRHPGTIAATVKVLDDQDLPVAGIRVTYRGKGEAQRGWALRQDFVTQADGTYPLQALLGESVLQVATSNNFQLLEYDQIEGDQNHPILLCRMPKTRLVTVRAFGPDSEPLSRNNVTAPAYYLRNPHNGIFRDLQTIALGPTDSRGSIVVEAPLEREWPLVIHSPQHGKVIVTIPPQVTEFDFNLGLGQSLSGKVVGPDGSPIPQAEIRVWTPDFHPADGDPILQAVTSHETQMRKAHSDADGNFQVTGLRETSKAYVGVSAEGMAYAIFQPVSIPSQDQNWVVQMQEELTISGRVVDGDGEPLARETIHIGLGQIFNGTSPWKNPSLLFGKAFQSTDELGRFEFNGLTADEWTITTVGTNPAIPPMQVKVPGGTQNLELQIVALDNSLMNLDCTVLDQNGERVTSNIQATVYFSELKRNGFRSSARSLITRSSTPQIVARGLEVDHYALEVKAPGYGIAYLQIEAEAGHHQQTIYLHQAVEVKIQLERPEGKKLYYCSIKAYAADGTLFPNGQRYADNLLSGKADPGLRSGAYGWLEMTVPASGGYFEVVAEEGVAPIRVDFGPEIAECTSLNPLVIKLEQ
jgi:RNA polymerase sigma-70 factor, ECF subfamily